MPGNPDEGILDEVLIAVGQGRNVRSGLRPKDIVGIVSPVYDRIRRNCLRAADWIFSEGQAVLEEDVGRPVFGFAAYYKQPSDYLKVIYMNGDNKLGRGWRDGWHPIGNRFAANFVPYLSYVRNITDEAEFPDHFRSYFIYKLAAECCLSIGGDKELRSNLHREAAMVKKEVVTFELTDHGTRETMSDDSIIASRQGTGYDSFYNPRVDVEETPVRNNPDGQSE